MTDKKYKKDLADCVKAIAEGEKGLVEIYTVIEEIKVSRTDDLIKLPSNVKRLSQTTELIAS